MGNRTETNACRRSTFLPLSRRDEVWTEVGSLGEVPAAEWSRDHLLWAGCDMMWTFTCWVDRNENFTPISCCLHRDSHTGTFLSMSLELCETSEHQPQEGASLHHLLILQIFNICIFHVNGCEVHLGAEGGPLQHYTRTFGNSVPLIGGAILCNTPPTSLPSLIAPQRSSPAILLPRCSHLNLNPSCSEVEVFNWDWFCPSLPPQDTWQCLETLKLTSMEDSHALLVLSCDSEPRKAVVSPCIPPADTYTCSSCGPPCTGAASGLRSVLYYVLRIHWNQK